MKARRRRILLRLAAAAGALALALALGAWFLLGTEAGGRWLFARVGTALAGSLSVEDLEGPLRGPLTVRGLLYESEAFEVRVATLALDWRLQELLARRLDIVRLEAQGVRVRLAEGEEDEETGKLPDVHLPVNIIVREARVQGVEVLSPGSEPLAIDSIELATRAHGSVVEIERLAVRSPDLEADVRGRVEPWGDYAVDLALAWSAALPDQPRWSGEGTLSGTLEELQVRHRFSAPIAARVEATLGKPLRDLTFDGTVEAEPFALATFDPSLPQATVAGRLSVRGAPEALRAEGRVAAETADFGPLDADLAFESRDERWRIERLVLTSRAAPAARIEAQGELTLPEEGEPGIDLAGSWRDLPWPLVGEVMLVSPEGRASVRGDLADYELEVAGSRKRPALADLPLPPSPVTLTGRGDAERLRLRSARAEILGGSLTASGEVAWSPRVEWRLSLAGEGLDPAAIWPEGRGDLKLAGDTSGYVAEAGPVGRVGPLAVSGTLRSEPVRATGAMDLAGERVSLSDLDLEWGTVRLAASGRVVPTYDFAFDLAAPNLGIVTGEAGGSLAARGRLGGPPETPRIAASFEGQGLAWGEISAESLRGEADLDLAPRGSLAFEVEGTWLALGERSFERVAAGGEGRREAHRLTLAADARAGGARPGGARTGGEREAGRLRLEAAGGLDAAGTWSGAIETLDLTVPEAGSWSLASPAALTASAEGGALEELCGVSGGARLCARGAWRAAGGWQVSADLTALPLALAATLLPPDVEVSGGVDGRIAARADVRGVLTAEAELRPGPGEVVYPVPDGGTSTLRFGQGEVRFTAGATGIEGALDLPLPGLGEASGELAMPGYRLAGAPTEAQPISGRLVAEITDLSFLQAFSTDLDDTAGRLSADLALAGTVGRPQVRGEARLTGGRAAVPRLGIRLTDLSLAATDRGGDSLILSGSVRSGEGTVELSGEAPAVPSPERPVRLAVTGRRFQAMNTREVDLLASPDLEMTFDGERIAVTGEVRVPEAQVEIKKPPQGVVTVSQDVVYIGDDRREAAAQALPFAMRVRVILGDEVEVDVLGLKAEPEGSLLLIEEPGKPSAVVGEIDLAGGTFEAYGQDLTIERGRLSFAGPMENPRVDLRAFRKAADGVVAGLEARGTLESPEITLWSEPPMDQTSQLSYILLGRPPGQVGAGDGDLLANAAVSLGLKGGNLLAERIAARFGLEEARIETTGGVAEASLVLGKYLSPRLYVAYGVGLFEAVNTLRVRYLLSRRWTLEATTGAATAADLLYTLERGRGARREAPRDGAPLAPREAPAATGAGPPPG